MIKLKRELIQEIAVNSGFNLKEQPNGEMGLDPYVYTFADNILSKAFNFELNRNFTIWYNPAGYGYNIDSHWLSHHLEMNLKIPLDILEKIKF